MTSALIGIFLVFLLSFLGVPLVVTMLLVGGVGFALVRGTEAAGSVVGNQIFDGLSSYGFTVIPLFILMGVFIYRAGLAKDVYDAARAWLGHRRGGLASTTIGACAAFSAVSGSSVATAATMSKVALPEMKRYKYNDGFACGTVAAGGTLGILIPPSVPLVIFGILTETSISGLFMAALVPGLLIAAMYMFAAFLVVKQKPELGETAERLSYRERIRYTRQASVVLLLFVVILGGMYSGVFTPTEAAGIGAFGAFLILITRTKENRLEKTLESLKESVITTASLLILMSAALVFNTFLTITGLTAELINFVNDLQVPPLGVVVAICVIYILMGSVFDSLAAMILTAPLFTPIVVSLGFDPLWFGVIVVIVVELGMITPPFGMNVFIVKGQAMHVPIAKIFYGVSPYILMNILALILLIAVPEIVLYLPSIL